MKQKKTKPNLKAQLKQAREKIKTLKAERDAWRAAYRGAAGISDDDGNGQ